MRRSDHTSSFICSTGFRIGVGIVFSILSLQKFLLASPPSSRGARPIALGNGYTAVSGDSYSLFYNPAGLADIAQQEVAVDYGRAYGVKDPTLTDFNGIVSMPYRYQDHYVPIAAGIYSEFPAHGARITDITVGGGTDVPADAWTKGFMKLPVRMGVAGTIRQQQGPTASDRVGKSSLGLGLTGGLIIPINKQHQFGFALRHLFLPKTSDVDGPSFNAGIVRHHRDYLDMFLDLEYSSGGIWAVHPGLEWLFARGVLRPRLGWGYHDSGGVDSLATGLGIYLSPVQIDIAYLIPLKTINDNAGQFRASLIYRFGRPHFSEVYYDKALQEAGQLDTNVLMLTTKEAELKSSLAELEQKQRIAKEELDNAKSRIEALKNKDLLGDRDSTIRDLKTRIKQLELDLNIQRHETSSLRQKKNEVRTHKVMPGETLQSIARDYYGDPNQWKRIYNSNPDKIERGLPKIGETLVIP